MNKTIIAVVIIIAVTCMIGVYIWSSHNRFYTINGSRDIVYEVDRVTGESWMLYTNQKFPMLESGINRQKEEEFSASLKELITGNAGISMGRDEFRGALYNGSNWVVTRAIFTVVAKEEDGTVRWSRDYSKAMLIRPLTNESFAVDIIGAGGIKEVDWSVKAVFGHKE